MGTANGYLGRQENCEVGLGAHVVKTLTSDLKHKYHHVYFNNFFTSVQVLQQGCGTDRRGFPPALKAHGLKERYDTFCTTYNIPYYLLLPLLSSLCHNYSHSVFALPTEQDTYTETAFAPLCLHSNYCYECKLYGPCTLYLSTEVNQRQ